MFHLLTSGFDNSLACANANFCVLPRKTHTSPELFRAFSGIPGNKKAMKLAFI